MFNPGDSVDQSLRRRGQRLVAIGVLLGALSGVALGLAVEDTGTSGAVAAPGRGAAAAASRPGSQPPASRAAGAGRRTAGNDSSGSQQVESADRSDKGHGKARKGGEGRQDKPGSGEPGKDKHNKGEPGKDNQDKGKDK
jgi:hypothetical protein